MKRILILVIVLFGMHGVFMQSLYARKAHQSKKKETCIFCDIVSGKAPAKIVAETKDILVIEDHHPQAPIHYLIIPKRHIVNIKDCASSDSRLLGDMLLITKELSKSLDFPQDYRLINNNGAAALQTVFHMHIHFLAGEKLKDLNLSY